MTIDELVLRLTRECEQSRDVVTDILQALADLAAAELAAGRRVQLPGLGSLKVGLQLRGDPPQAVVTWASAPELSRAMAAARAAQIAAAPPSPAAEAWVADRAAEARKSDSHKRHKTHKGFRTEAGARP
jgi:hypothetical protein